MKKVIPVLLLTLFLAVSGAMVHAEKEHGSAGGKVVTTRSLVKAIRGISHDTAVARIDAKTYRDKSDEIAKAVKGTWESVYLPSAGLLLLSRIDSKVTKEEKAEQAAAVEKTLKELLAAGMKDLVWGVQLRGGGDTLLFPAGRIYVLFDETLNMAARKRILAPFSELQVRYFEDRRVQRPVRNLSFVQGDASLPDYARTAALQGIKPPREAEGKTEGVIRRPFAVLNLPAGREHETFALADKIAGIPGIRIASPDFHALGKRLATYPTTSPPPSPSAATFISRAGINRAWWLFYPMSYMGSAAFPNHFLCSDVSTAVLDANFHDHPSLRQLFIGYDALDNDQDPRTPIDPAGLSTTDAFYLHGIEMSGVIGGLEQSTDNKCGVAPGTFIVPIRPLAIENVDLSTREGTDQFIAEYADDWWNALHRLYILSSSENVTVANYSGTSNELIFDVTNMKAWISWFLNQGNWGYGIFFTASAGNDAASRSIAFPAKLSAVFAVGWGDYQNNTVLGNHGAGLEVTVADGWWPAYSPTGNVYTYGGNSGGTSVSSAIVSGVATLMRVAGGTSVDTRDQLSTILRYSTRFSDAMVPAINSDGYHAEYGYGFLDAYQAVKTAYKAGLRPLGAAKVRFTASEPAMLVQQAGFPPDANEFPGRPTGVFWSLKQETDSSGAYWKHVRLDENTRHCEIVIDPISPMGGFVAGDYDGDGLDEIVMQLGYWTDHPESHLIAEKFDDASVDWHGLGSPISSFPFVQYVLPQDEPVRQLFAARLEDLGRSDVVAVQGTQLNAARYDGTEDRWKPLGTADYAPRLVSASVMSEIRGGWLSSYRQYLERIEPYRTYHGKQALMVVSRVRKKNWLLFWKKARQHVIVSYLQYRAETGTFENVPINSLGETHRIVRTYTGEPKPFSLLVDDFDGDTDQEAVLKLAIGQNDLILIDSTPGTQETPPLSYLTTSVHLSSHPEVGLNVRSGDVDGDTKAELAFLTGFANDNTAAFLDWSSTAGSWATTLPPLAHKRKNNRAKDLLVGDFNSDGIAEVGMLMAEPNGNIYLVYQMNGGQFMKYGIW